MQPPRCNAARPRSAVRCATVDTSRAPIIGFTPNTYLVASEHIEHDAAGYFVTNGRMETSAPGLFAVGDVRSQLVRQITTAVGDATTAAIAVERYITELKQQRAVAGVSAELYHKYI